MKFRTLKSVIKSIIISVIIYLVASFVIVMLLYEGIFSRVEKYEYNSFISYEDMVDYSPREITFNSRGFEINGVIYENSDSTDIVILGHTKGGNGEDMLSEAKFFLDNGYSAMVFDYVGCGNSGGSSQVGLQQPVYNFNDAISFASSEGYEHIYLFGNGVGGYAASACSNREEVVAVVAVSAFSSISDMTLEYATSNMGILGYLEYPVMLLYQYLIYGGDIFKDAVFGINESNVPIVIINGTSDEVVLSEGAALINAKQKITNPNVTYKIIENGKHSSLLRSESANAFLEQFNSEAYELYNAYGGNVPKADIDELYARYSREEMSELNLSIMNEILDIFNSARSVS